MNKKLILFFVLVLFVAGCAMVNTCVTLDEFNKLKKDFERSVGESLKRDMDIVDRMNDFADAYNRHLRDLHGLRFKIDSQCGM